MTKVVINKKNFKVNGGKEFELPELTVKKHEAILNRLANEKDKYTNEEYTREVQKEMVYYILHEVDSGVTKDAILDLHPEEFTDLSNAIWGANRRQDEKKFRIQE